MKHENNRIPIYVIVCKNQEGKIIIPPYTAFEEDEALAFYDTEHDEPSSPAYKCELIKILKVFELENGEIVWANREAVGRGAGLYITIDKGLRGRPFIYFNKLVEGKEELDISSLHIARVY